MNRFGVINLLVAIGLVAVVSAIDCNNPPERIDLKTCCPHNDLISKDIADKCKSHLDTAEDTTPTAGPGPRGRKHRPNPCYMECVLNTTEIMNGEDIDEAKLKAYLSTVLSDSPDFVPVVEKAFETCVQKHKDFHEMMANNPPPPPPPNKQIDGKMCKPSSAMLLHCVIMETTFNCPESAWKDDDSCNNHREFFKNCKPPHPHPHPHPHGHGEPPK